MTITNLGATLKQSYSDLCDLDNERAILASVLIDPESLIKIPYVNAGHFFLDKHQWIFNALRALEQNDKAIDLITVSTTLKEHGQLAQGKIEEYELIELANSSAFAANIESYAQAIIKKFVQRQLFITAQKFAGIAFDGAGKTAQDLLAESNKLFEQITLPQIESIVSLNDAMNNFFPKLSDMINHPRETWGIPTGLDIDKYMGGLQSGDLVIIAADAKCGKSALLYSILQYVAQCKNVPSLLFNLEMGEDGLMTRVFARMAQANSLNLQRGKITDFQLHQLIERMGQSENVPLYFYHRPIDTTGIRAVIAQAVRRKGIQVVGVDYAKLLLDKHENEVLRIGYITMRLKQIAKEFGVALILIHQLKDDGGNANRKPRLSDMAWSRQAGYDLDVALFPYTVTDKSGEQHFVNVWSRRGQSDVDVKLFFNKEQSFWSNAQ